MKVAILTPGLVNKGGAERIVLLQAKRYNADIYAGRYNPKTTFEEFRKCKVRPLIKGGLPRRLGTLQILHRFKQLKLENYDLYILHGGASLAASRKHHPNIWYCHAPNRWLYDLYKHELKKFSFPKKQMFQIFSYFMRKDDQGNVKHVDKILVNAKNTGKRVRKYYNRSSDIVHPPCNLKRFKWIKQDNFYLSTGRVDPIKRIYLIVKAFQKMPGKKLVVASGGPDLKRIRSLAKGYDNINVLGWVSEEKLKELYGGCIATINATLYEDFGMVAVESMAAGKPVIATNRGGFTETVLHKKTGLLINPTPDNIIKAVKWLTPKKALKMRKTCEQRAKQFSEKRFLEKMDKAVKKTIQK